MSAGITMKGERITLTIGSTSLAGTVTKQLDASNSPIETTDADSSGWQEFAAEAGVKGFALNVDGKLKNMELYETFVNSTSQMAEAVITFDDLNSTASVLTFDAFIESIGLGMPTNDGSTFTCSLKSSGVPVFVAGT